MYLWMNVLREYRCWQIGRLRVWVWSWFGDVAV